MKVKICGVTHPQDAQHAARSGAEYIGIIFAQNSKRRVSLALARHIVLAARDGGAQAVGVFVDEAVDEIRAICRATDIGIVQLHGNAHSERIAELQSSYSVIYAIPIHVDGSPMQHVSVPDRVLPLYDNSGGGRGTIFDWNAFQPPINIPWILAGGLNPTNVSLAIRLLHPHVVDVASGVEIRGCTRKDPHAVATFIRNAKRKEII